eukprot:gene28514-34422_t
MTAVTGANFRSGEAYWELSGPTPINRIATCRACRQSIPKGASVMVRDGRKLRFFYHEACFTGTEDPRTQANSTFQQTTLYHTNTAPKLSSLEGPKACVDADGRVLTRKVFHAEAPSTVGHGKWSVRQRGYQPKYTT